MTVGRAGAAVLVTAGVAVALPAAALAAPSSDEVSSPEPAGGAAIGPSSRLDQQLNFQGVVLFTWVDHAGLHRAVLPVRGEGGLVQIGGRDGPQGVEWPAEAGPLPSLVAKYQTSQTPGPLVASRPTTNVQIRSAGGSTESLALDRATGLILSRVELNSDGSMARSMQFQQVTFGPASGSRAAARPSPFMARTSISRLPSEYTAPLRLADDYQRVAAQPVSGGLRVIYSDGIHGLSVFEQPGHLAGGKHSYQWAGGEVLTWQDGPTVLTAVGDGPSTDVATAIRSIPQPRQLGLLGRLGSLSREVIDTLNGND